MDASKRNRNVKSKRLTIKDSTKTVAKKIENIQAFQMHDFLGGATVDLDYCNILGNKSLF